MQIDRSTELNKSDHVAVVGVLQDQVKENALHSCAAFGDIKLLSKLLQAGSDAVNTFHEDETPLYAACKHGHPLAVVILLEHGADPRIAAKRTGNTPLHALAFYARKSTLDCLALLISYGANVNSPSINGYTPLHAAAFAGNTMFCEVLLEHGALVSNKSFCGLSPKDVTRSAKVKELLSLFGRSKKMLDNAAAADALPQSPRSIGRVDSPRRHSISGGCLNNSLLSDPLESPRSSRTVPPTPRHRVRIHRERSVSGLLHSKK